MGNQYEALNNGVSRFWLPDWKLYIVSGDCNPRDAARNFAMTNERAAPVFYTTTEPGLTARGTLIFPDGSETTTTLSEYSRRWAIRTSQGSAQA